MKDNNLRQKVLVVNHKIKNCGVYQYGKRCASILTDDNLKNIGNRSYYYLEAENEEELTRSINDIEPKIVLFNHLNGTMPFLDQKIVSDLRKNKIIQGTFVHNVGYNTMFDFFLHQDPDYKDSENNYHILRPLFKFDDFSEKESNDDVFRIGSFGFGFNVKKYDSLCAIVNSQFSNSEKQVEINLHLTLSHFCDNSQMIKSVIQSCKNQITNNNIHLNITTEFMSDEDVLKFLNKNDVNVFLYHYYSSYNGISSVIDYALSCKKPFAVCKSNMFSHVNKVTPSICVEDQSLIDVIKNKLTPVQHLIEAWNRPNFKLRIEQILNDVESKYVF